MLEIGRGALVVFAGYAAMTALVWLADPLLAAFFPGAGPEQPSAVYVYGSLGWGFLAAFAGGWIAARVAAMRPFLHAGVLASAIVALGLMRMGGEPLPGQPSWFMAVILVLAAAGALAGGFVAARRR